MTDPAIQHDPAARRFSTVVDGVEAELDYTRAGTVLSIVHTGVPEAIGGRGIAGRLVEAAVEFAKAQSLKIRPACAYAAAWMERHPEHADLRA